MSTLSDLLKDRGMKLVDLARELKVNKATVSRWGQKEVPTDRLAAVEKATGIPPGELRPDLASVFAPDPAQPAPEPERTS